MPSPACRLICAGESGAQSLTFPPNSPRDFNRAVDFATPHIGPPHVSRIVTFRREDDKGGGENYGARGRINVSINLRATAPKSAQNSKHQSSNHKPQSPILHPAQRNRADPTPPDSTRLHQSREPPTLPLSDPQRIAALRPGGRVSPRLPRALSVDPREKLVCQYATAAPSII